MKAAGKDRMHWTSGGGAIALAIIAIPLLREFWEPGHMLWNILLVSFAVGMIVAAVLLQRFFYNHIGKVGEARFDTRNKSDANV